MRDERGFALPLAMLVVLILSALMLGLAQTLTSEFSAALPASRDLRAGYLAQAGIEHQIYLLKANKGAAAIALTNFPVTPGLEYWYSTTLTCLLNCGTNFETRRWQIVSTGEVHLSGTSTVVQTRSIRAVVEIHYGGSGASLFLFPITVVDANGRLIPGVLVLRWEEVYP